MAGSMRLEVLNTPVSMRDRVGPESRVPRSGTASMARETEEDSAAAQEGGGKAATRMERYVAIFRIGRILASVHVQENAAQPESAARMYV